MSASTTAEESEQSHSPVEPEDNTLQQASRLDTSRLKGAGGPTYVIIYLHGLQTALDVAGNESISRASGSLQDTLSSLWAKSRHDGNTDAAVYCAGRPYRGLLGRIYVTLFTKLNGSGLFDAASSWLTLATSGTAVLEIRITAFHIIAAVFTRVGSSIPSLATDCLNGAMRTFRTSSHPYRLRYAASVTAASCLSSCGATMNQNDARDLCKQLRSCLADKSGIIQKGAAELFNSCFYLHSVQDIDQVLSISFKTQEQSDWQARQHHAQLCSSLLLLTQVARAQADVLPPNVQASGSTLNKDGRMDVAEAESQVEGKRNSTTILSVKSMLQRLADAFHKPSNGVKGRNNIIQILALLFTRLGSTYICENIDDIWNILLQQFVGGIKARSTSYQLRVAEAYITFLIGHLVCRQLLRETEQMDMVRYFVRRCSESTSDTTKADQSSLVLRMSLRQLDCLLRSLGRSTLAEDFQTEKTLSLLCAHADRLVQMQARQCLATYARSMTHRLPLLLAEIMERLESLLLTVKDETHNPHALLGQAQACSSLLSILSALPMYASRDTCTRAMSLASQLLKAAGDQDLTISRFLVGAAWEILGGLLSLPERMMNVHLSQILLLWKNALPKASHRETTIAEKRTIQDWSFLLSVRAAALRSIVCYLSSHAPKRSDDDLVRRIITLLNHAISFNASVPMYKCQPDDTVQNVKISELETHQAEFIENLLNAYSHLAAHPLVETSRVPLCNLCMVQMIRREAHMLYLQSSLHQPLSADGFWDGTHAVPAVASNTDLRTFDNAAPVFGMERSLAFSEYVIEDIPRRPGAIIEGGDSLSDYNGIPDASEKAADLVDAAAQLFASLFPLLSTAKQIQYIQSLTDRVQTIAGAPGRSEKTLSLSLASLLGVATLAARSLVDVRKVFDSVDESLLVKMRDLLQIGLLHSDSIVRSTSSRGIASLCKLGSSTFLSSQIQAAVALVVANTDPFVRSGCVQLFADIYSIVGAIAARPALRTVVDITMTLAADPHPTVHYWSLRALTVIIDVANLDFTPFISPCLGLVAKINTADSHDSEGGSLATASMRGDLPVRQAICAVLGCLITAAGPGLYDMRTAAQAVSAIVEGFLFDEDVRVVVQAGIALQHLLLVSPPSVISPHVTGILVNQLHSPILAVQISAVNSIYQVVRRDVYGISRLAGDKLVERLFTILDADPAVSGVRQTITAWMLQTAANNPAGWLAICQKILSQDASHWQVADKQGITAAIEDEEAQGLRAMAEGEGSPSAQTLARWQTRAFALTCLCDLLKYLRGAGADQERRPGEAASMKLNGHVQKLHSKIPDLMRMALLACTSPNLDLKMQGLQLLQEVVKTFGKENDDHFDNEPLLQQYQASIIAAAAPAFESGTEPELLLAAVELLGLFVSAGISQTVSEGSRALRLLEGCLERCTEAQTALASAAPVKTACAAAWARICLSSTKDAALKPIINARGPTLLALWRDALLSDARNAPSGHAVDDSAEKDLDEDCHSLFSDFESWLLILKAWTILSSETASQLDFANHFWGLLSEVCRCIDRYILAERLQPSAYETADLTLDCLSSLLKLAMTLKAYRHESGTWNELLQIAYRLYLLDSVSIDRQLVTYVATLALCARDELEASEKHAQLQACCQLGLLICNRNLREGSENAIATGASAWMAVNAICILGAPELRSGMLTAPWILVIRHLSGFRIAAMPASLLLSTQQAAALLMRQSLQDDPESLQALDRIIAGFACAFERSLRDKHATVAATRCLQILSVLAGVAISQECLITEDLVTILCKCLRQAVTAADTRVRQEGILFAKVLSCTTCPGNNGAALLAARVLCEVLALLSILDRHGSVSDSETKALVGLTVGLGESHHRTRSLLLSAYAWLTSRQSEASDDSIVHAVVNLLQHGPGFKQAYEQLSSAQQHQIQEAIARARGNNVTAKTHEAPPTIALKLFS